MHQLLEKNLSPRQAFLEIYTFLQTNNVLTEFSPLLDFLRIASTADTTVAPANQHLSPGPMFCSDKKLVSFMKDRVLYRDLHFHDPCTVPEANRDNQLTKSLALLTNAQLKANATNDRAKTKSTTDVFGETNV